MIIFYFFNFNRFFVGGYVMKNKYHLAIDQTWCPRRERVMDPHVALMTLASITEVVVTKPALPVLACVALA